RAITHHVKRGGKIWIRIFPDKPVTAKPAETRMGSGKGAVDHYVAVVKPGRVMFELGGVRADIAHEALLLAAQKMPIKCKIIGREDVEAAERRTMNCVSLIPSSWKTSSRTTTKNYSICAFSR